MYCFTNILYCMYWERPYHHCACSALQVTVRLSCSAVYFKSLCVCFWVFLNHRLSVGSVTSGCGWPEVTEHKLPLWHTEHRCVLWNTFCLCREDSWTVYACPGTWALLWQVECILLCRLCKNWTDQRHRIATGPSSHSVKSVWWR